MFPPFIRTDRSVRSVMASVLLALLPSVAVYFFLFGPPIIISLGICTVSCLLAEWVSLLLRKKTVIMFPSDGSAVVTAWLIALSFPPISPWWMLVIASITAIAITKHLYGGLGNNIFNPAMMAYAICLLCYPQFMTKWVAVQAKLSWSEAWSLIVQQKLNFSGLTQGTVLDTVRTGLTSKMMTLKQIKDLSPQNFGQWGSPGYEWVSASYCVGGVLLWYLRIITWHMPIPFIFTLSVLSLTGHIVDPNRFVGIIPELLSGGTMLAAWFIITDPVSGATTTRGKVIFSVGIALLTFIIRHLGGYPDGIAFAVILLNSCVPVIDRYTQPAVFGRGKK
ncbi:RnfABCDGE type electron transport complex subunit D [Candidatus Ichthyocystis sparus]|uniref:RnfABCDGE type electron transport complex subunit D n=1 Tax=Candidatus Ichthyocystis sparus TaxID=1561004 RepID=UPI000A444802|nr:RnfABCDGE type electron transport complex subunit D [Candidatus Ichthyocystis sparus]